MRILPSDLGKLGYYSPSTLTFLFESRKGKFLVESENSSRNCSVSHSPHRKKSPFIFIEAELEIASRLVLGKGGSASLPEMSLGCYCGSVPEKPG
jgi:hypothetical protein